MDFHPESLLKPEIREVLSGPPVIDYKMARAPNVGGFGLEVHIHEVPIEKVNEFAERLGSSDAVIRIKVVYGEPDLILDYRPRAVKHMVGDPKKAAAYLKSVEDNNRREAREYAKRAALAAGLRPEDLE